MGAAHEVASGNISLGNTSIGNESAWNHNAHHTNLNPGYSASSMRVQTARGSTLQHTASGTTFAQVPTSQFPIDVNFSELQAHSLQQARQAVLTSATNDQHTLTHSEDYFIIPDIFDATYEAVGLEA